MELEDYFDFLSAEDIRIKGTRIGIETILSDYLDGHIPEEMALHYPSISLEQIYATLTYYWRNRAAIDAYLEEWRRHGDRMWLEQQRHLPEVVRRVRAMAQKRREERRVESADGHTP